MDTVRKLKSRLALLDMRTEDLAEVIGVNPATLYRWYNLNCRTIPLEKLHQIGKALNLTKDEFMDIFLPNYSQN